MKHTLYVIPGFGENTKMPDYKAVIKACRLFGYEVIEFNPCWDRSVASDWILDFERSLQKNKSAKTSIIGFSFGAYVAVLSAQKFKFEKLVLCSLSPYFADNIPEIPEAAWKFFGKRRKQDFSKHHFPVGMQVDAAFLVGEHEIPMELKHVNDRYKSWSGKKTHIIVKGAEHSIGSGEYLNQIIETIKKP